ncbi:MAG: alanine racemase, partial [Acidobacteriota bacterium]
MKSSTLFRPEAISPYYKWAKSLFTISGMPVKGIMAFAGTPSAYIYDAATIKYNYCKLRQSLPKRVEIYYAMKANPNIAIVKLLNSFGAGVDVASIGELLACEKVKTNPNNIAYTAPVKNKTDLDKALEMGVYINVESLHEANLLSRLATQLGKEVAVGLRVNPRFHIEGAHLTLGGNISSKFGIDFESVPALYKEIRKLPNLRVNGIHISVASGVLSVEGLLQYYRRCFGVAHK